MTVIYPSPIFGPVHSRRLGVSLGINLLPEDGKVCSFDCIYCECGFNADHRPKKALPTREEVRNALEARLQDMQRNGPQPDVLTFAGNGEPTARRAQWQRFTLRLCGRCGMGAVPWRLCKLHVRLRDLGGCGERGDFAGCAGGQGRASG